MLIIQHGMETVGNQYISQRLHVCLNNYSAVNIDGYIVDFTHTPTVIRNAVGEIVYQAGTDNNKIMLTADGSLNEAGHATLHKILELETTKYKPVYTTSASGVTDLASSNPQRVRLLFGYIWDDLGLPHGVGSRNLPDTLAAKQSVFDQIINQYNTRPDDQPCMIINGSFTKAWIDKFRAHLGEANVKVISVTRNVSTTYALQYNVEYPQDFVNTTTAARVQPFQSGPRLFDGSNATNYEPFHTRFWIFNLLNTITLQSVDYVEKIRYEDILSSGLMSVAGIQVKLDALVNYNGLTTQAEHELLTAQTNVTADTVDAANTYFSTFTDFTNAHTFDASDIDLKTVFGDYTFPSNFFADLEYDPLTLSRILANP